VIDAAAVRRAWPGILEKAKQGSRSTGALLMNATVKAVEDDTLVLTIAAAPLARRLSEQRNTDVISAALRAELGVAWRVRCEHDGGQSGTGNSGPSGGNPGPSGGNGGAGGTGGAGRAGGNGAPAKAPQAPPRRAPVSRPGPSDPPPPPEPPPDDEEEMLAEAAYSVGDGEPASRRDPEEVAIELLTTQLGARAVEDPRG
jgi:DNA polymerase-3 subunit gamma/tau